MICAPWCQAERLARKEKFSIWKKSQFWTKRKKQKCCFVRVEILNNILGLALFLFVCFGDHPPEKAKSGSCYTKENRLPTPNTNAAEQPRCLQQLKVAVLQGPGQAHVVLVSCQSLPLNKHTDAYILAPGESFMPGFTASVNSFKISKCWLHNMKNVMG